MKNNKKKPLWLIEWGDAWGSAGWKDVEWISKEHSPMLVSQVGFIVKSDKLGVSLASGFSETNAPLAVSFIPRGMIRKIKKLKY